MIYPLALTAFAKSTKNGGEFEEFHKSVKQNTSLSKSPTKTIRAQCNHLFAAMIAFCKLELLKVKTAMNHFAIKHKLILKANQIMFKELRALKATA